MSTANTFPWPDFDSWAMAPENWVALPCRCTEGDQCVRCQAALAYDAQNGDPLGTHDAARAYLVEQLAVKLAAEQHLSIEMARVKADAEVQFDDGIYIGTDPCDMLGRANCSRTDLHGHSGFEIMGIGGDGDTYDWYVPAAPVPPQTGT